MKATVKQCEECGKRHNPERPHCPQCGQAMSQHQQDRIFGWGCWPFGCGFWIPDDPRRSKDGGLRERKWCCECKGFVPHHFWIYDEKGKRWGDWLCVRCYGSLPEGRENVQKDTPSLSRPARLTV